MFDTTNLEEMCIQITAEETPMTKEEVRTNLENLNDWALLENEGGFRLQRLFRFETFGEALEFLNRLGELALRHQHFPALHLMTNQVSVTCWTPMLKGLHRNDFLIAAHANDLFDRWDVISGKRDKVEEASDDSFPASDPPSY